MGSITALASISWYFIKNKLKNIDERQNKTEARIDSIENTNAVKIGDIQREIAKMEISNERRHGDLKFFLTDNFVKKTDCEKCM